MEKVLETNGLSKKYNKFYALQDVSINVNKGDVYGLIGKNGAGKTTFFKLVMGLASRTSGEIKIGIGTDLCAGRSKIGFMIGTTFFPYFTAKQNIEYYRRLKGIKDKEETSRVLKLVELYGVNKPYKHFSMGMKQRLGLANALLGSPEIIILDEPINGLDPQGINDIRNLIKEINEKEGVSFIISSHILSELDLVATRFGFIDKGNLLKEVSYEDLHQSTSKALIVEVDDYDKAINIISKNLETQNFTSGKNKSIILSDYLEEPNKVAKILINNGIELYSLKKQETTLEEYFINLIGGDGND